MAAILFLLASALALTAAASPSWQCTTAFYGIKLGSPVRLADVMLEPGVKAHTLLIPTTACPSPTRAVGTLVQVCDPEGPPPPEVSLQSLSAGLAVRMTRAVLPATFSASLYCALAGARAGGGDADRGFRALATPTNV